MFHFHILDKAAILGILGPIILSVGFLIVIMGIVWMQILKQQQITLMNKFTTAVKGKGKDRKGEKYPAMDVINKEIECMQRSKTLLNIENDLRRYMDEHTHVSPKRVPAAINQHAGKVAMASPPSIIPQKPTTQAINNHIQQAHTQNHTSNSDPNKPNNRNQPSEPNTKNALANTNSLQVPGNEGNSRHPSGHNRKKPKTSKWYPNEKVVLRNFSHAKPGDRDWKY